LTSVHIYINFSQILLRKSQILKQVMAAICTSNIDGNNVQQVPVFSSHNMDVEIYNCQVIEVPE
jgi:hypothetical protein